MTREQMARILAEAEFAPSFSVVLKRHSVQRRTFSRWRNLAGLVPGVAASDPELARLVQKELKALRPLVEESRAAVVADWKHEAIEFLRVTFRKLTEHATNSEPKHIRQLAGAVKITAEALTVREALNVHQPGGDLEDPEAEEAPRDISRRLLDAIH